MQNHIALDIETVPLKDFSEYSEIVRQKIEERIARRQERDPEFDYTYFASIHADFAKIICISLGYITDNSEIRLKSLAGDDERALLEQFNQIIKKHQGIYIHYNGLNFDVPFIIQRMSYHGMLPGGRSFGILRRFSMDPHFDVMMQYYNWDLSRSLPLGILAELHHLPNPKDELSGNKVYETYQKGDWKKIIRYCEYDTATTLNLWQKIFLSQPVIPLESYIFSE